MRQMISVNSFNQAGGAFYHWSAFRYGKKLWFPFHQEVKHWLLQLEKALLSQSFMGQKNRRLLIIGASGGYALPESFLINFEKITIIDPDPLAEWIFRKRFSSLKQIIEWRKEDWICPEKKKFDPQLTLRSFDFYPDEFILFSNFLGQLPVLYRDAIQTDSFEEWRVEIARYLEKRSWASFHEIYSGAIKPEALLRSGRFVFDEEISQQELIQRCYLASKKSLTNPVELFDHEMEIFSSLLQRNSFQRSYWTWERVPGYYHLVEAMWGLGSEA
jgi:hypothetical protein